MQARPPLTQRVLYLAVHAAIAHFRVQAVGAVFNTIIRDTFARIDYVLPDPALLRVFNEIVAAIFSQADNLLNQLRLLRQSRDLLLPRLMSGEVTL